MLKLKMMLCVMMLLVVVGCMSAVRQSVREATASGVDNGFDWQTPLNGIISIFREGDYYVKQLEGKSQKYINRG